MNKSTNPANKRAKKITLRLDQDLANAFDQKAKRLGLTKAKLLREWIEKLDDSMMLRRVKKTKKLRSFTFRLDKGTAKKLTTLASETGVSRSTLLRIIIQNNAFPTNVQKTQKEAKVAVQRLWIEGKLSEIVDRLGDDIERLTIDELTLYAQTNNELGELSEVKQTLDLLYKKTITLDATHPILSSARLIEARRELFLGNVGTSESLIKNVLHIALAARDRHLISKAYTLLGEIARLGDDLNKAESYYKKALDYLDIVNYPIQTMEVYLRLATLSLYGYRAGDEKSSYYLTKTKKLLESVGNIHYWSRYFLARYVNDYSKRDIHEAGQSLNQSIKLNKKSRSKKALLYGYEGLLRLSIYNEDKDETYNTIRKIERFEDTFRPDVCFTRTRIFKLFVRSADKYTDTIQELKLFKEADHKPIRPNLTRYALHSAQYINGPDKLERRSGELGLKKLASEGDTESIRNLAEQTLETRKFYPDL